AESRHRIGQEHGLGADPHELATFGERDDELAVEAEVRLEGGRRGRLQRLAPDGVARALPRRPLRLGQLRPVRRERERAPPLGDATLGDERANERVEALRGKAKRRTELLAPCARAQWRTAMSLREAALDAQRQRLVPLARQAR